MRLITTTGACLAMVGCQPATPTASTDPAEAPVTREIAFIANAEDATVSLLDVAQRKIVGTLDTNPDKVVVTRPGTPNYAQDTDISPDGHTLFVSRGYMGDVAAFDIGSGKLLWVRKLDTGRADHMTLTSDGHWIFVSLLFDNSVEKIDAATGEGKGRFATGVYPHDNQISADGSQVYNTSLGQIGALQATPGAPAAAKDSSNSEHQFTIADVETLQVVGRIKMPFGIRPWHMKPDASGFYAQMSNQHAVAAFDFPSGRETRRLELPVKPGVTAADWDFEAPHHGLALSHDGSVLCLAGRSSDYVALVKAPELALLATIPLDDAPGWATMADHDQLCLVANTRSDNVSIISIAERKEIARLPTGNGPKHVTVSQVPVDVLDAVLARR